MFHVATFGHDTTGFTKRTIGNHNETKHITLRTARVQAMSNVMHMLTDGFEFDGVYGPSDGDACLEGIRVKRFALRLMVGIWEE